MCHTWTSWVNKGASSPSCKTPAGLPAWVQAQPGSRSPRRSRVLPLLHTRAPTWLVSCHGAAACSSALVPGRLKSCIQDAQSNKICSLQGKGVSRPWEDPLQVTALMGRRKAEAKWFCGPQGLCDPCYKSVGIDCSSAAANVLGGS